MVPNPIGLALPHAEWRNCTACTHIGDFGCAKSTGDDVSKRTELGCQTGPSTVVLASKPASACLLRLAMGVANPPGAVVAAFFHPRRLEGPHWAILEPKSVPSVILDKFKVRDRSNFLACGILVLYSASTGYRKKATVFYKQMDIYSVPQTDFKKILFG